jgi:hypothetical protein
MKLSQKQKQQRSFARWDPARAGRSLTRHVTVRLVHYDSEGIRLNARIFAFSVLTSGTSFQKVSDLFLFHNIVLPSRSRLYAVQKEFFGPIRDYCLAQCQYWRSQMADGAVVAFDGSWSHRRCAKECIVILIDCGQKRIVDFEIVIKSKGGVAGNDRGSSNGMELEGLRNIIGRWKGDPKVKGCVHDNDSKATEAIREADWQIEQMYDPNHVVKQFERRWNSSDTRLLRGLHAKLLMWFRYLIRSDFSVGEKEHYWWNTVEHFKGNHAGCPRQHPASDRSHPLAQPGAERQLRDVLARTVDLLSRARTGFDTQLNESCNSLKAKFANKDTSWKCSWSARVMCALMQVNSTDNWRIALAGLCGVTLPDEVRRRLDDRWRRHEYLQALRSTPEYHSRERLRRREVRQGNNQSRAGIADYHTAVPGERADGAGVSEQADQIISYERALRNDRSIEVPEEDGDASVRIVRNKLRSVPPSRRIPPPLPFTESFSGRTSEADDGIAATELQHDPDEEEDDQEHIEALESLPSGVPICDNTFDFQGMVENTFVMSSRYRRPILRPDRREDSPCQVLVAIDAVSSASDEETEEVTWPPFPPGTVLIEKSTGIRLQFVVPAVNNRWLMFDPEREHLRRMLPDELQRLE